MLQYTTQEPCLWPPSTQYCVSATFQQCEHHFSDRQGEEQSVRPVTNESVNQFTLGTQT